MTVKNIRPIAALMKKLAGAGLKRLVVAAPALLGGCSHYYTGNSLLACSLEAREEAARTGQETTYTCETGFLKLDRVTFGPKGQQVSGPAMPEHF